MKFWGAIVLCAGVYSNFALGQVHSEIMNELGAIPSQAYSAQSWNEEDFQKSIADVLEREIKTRYSGGEDTSKVFNTNLDWHSSVHAHWALLRLNRITSQYVDLAELVESRLTRENILHEFAIIKRATTYEFPYGRAWFLKLAIEFDQWADQNGVDDRERLKEMADYIADNILVRFEKRETLPVSTGEYPNPAWALTQLFHYYMFYESDSKVTRVLALVDKHFVKTPVGGKRFADDVSSGQYFSKYGNWLYLLSQTQSDEVFMGFLKDNPISDEGLKVPEQVKIRVAGLVWSRAWALKALIVRLKNMGEPTARYESAYQAHYDTGVSYHQRWKDNTSYTHWVSQFAVYATTEGVAPAEFVSRRRLF